MIRIVVENLLLFLLPTGLYLAYHYVKQGDGRSASKAINDAPLIWLFAAGAGVVIVVLFVFSQTEGGRPGQHYQPPVLKDGRIEPGRIE